MSEKSIAIIGAGIAGLAAGCYGRMNGYRTHIFEMDVRPGGLCTSWKRGDYTFDGCIHWLVGSREGPLYEMWREVGALPGLANFWMAGQWVMPGGGLPSALISGRQVIQLIRSEEGIEFTANQPEVA